MLYHKYKPLASRVYCTGLALLLVLSEVFSSNVQDTLPGFSRIMRLGLTGCAVLLLAGKIILLTGYEARWQKVLIAVVLVYTAFSSWYGGDLWFFLAALIGLGAKDVDWETAEGVRQQDILRACLRAARRAGSVQSLRRVCLQSRVAL